MQPTDLTAAEKLLLKTFETEISAIINKNRSDIVLKLVEKYKLEPDDAQITEYSEQWEELNGHASTLFKELKIVNCTSDWEKHVKAINAAADNLRNGQFVDLTGEKNSLSNFILKMSKLVANLKKLKKFENSSLSIVVGSNASNALKHFTDTANTIVTANDYSTSNLKKMDDLLADTDKSLKDNFSGLDLTLVSKQSFVALAAPSMEGKTQAAFTLRRVKPLYFCLSEVGAAKDGPIRQPIYSNFSSHSSMLRACAKADVDSIKGDDEALKITTGNLTDLKSQKFWTLGFLVGLVTNCSSPAAGSNESWMGNYAKVKGFYFPQLSINDIPKDFFKEFCLFLDEYVADSWAIFVRNLARVREMPCVCSNTNTKIANIIGKDDGSGSSGEPVRSIVVTRLNSPCLEYLDKEYGLKASIQAIKTAALRNISDGNEAKNPVCRFLNDFLDKQLPCLRPGVAVYIARTLGVLSTTEMVQTGKPTLGWLLDFMVGQLASDLVFRKSRLFTREFAFLAKIGLMVPETYFGAKDNTGYLMKNPSETVLRDLKPSRKRTIRQVEGIDDEEAFADMFERLEIARDVVNDQTRKEGFSYQKMFIEDHLYYIVNPQIEGKWMFVTFLPDTDQNSTCLRTILKGFVDWEHELTYFETNELMTMLACLSIPSQLTTSALLKSVDESIYSKPQSISNNQNPRAMALPGNPLEFSVAVSVVDASQHSFDTDVEVQRIDFMTNALETKSIRKYSFSGQTGTTFVKNLIVNLIEDKKFDYNNRKVNIKFFEAPEFDLEADYLNKCRIPYLYSLNRSIPLLNKLSNPSTDFLVDRYIRTANHERIDGRFKFLLDGEVGRAVIECKHYGSELTPAHLEVIICKAFEIKNAMLSLIFCPQATESPDDTDSFYEFCELNEINAFRVIKTEANSFEVVPLLKTLPLFTNPEFVCILFELKRINKPM